MNLQYLHFSFRDAKQNLESRVSVLETKSGSTSSANKIRIYFACHFRQGIYIKIKKCEIKLIHTFV